MEDQDANVISGISFDTDFQAFLSGDADLPASNSEAVSLAPSSSYGLQCSKCAKYRSDIERLEKEHRVNFQFLKRKVISTDMLIRRFKAKQDEAEAHAKTVLNLRQKLDNANRDSNILSEQLKSAMESIKPLKESKDQFECELHDRLRDISGLRDQLKAEEALRNQRTSIVHRIKELESERLMLETKIKHLETRNSQLRTNLKKMECDKKTQSSQGNINAKRLNKMALLLNSAQIKVGSMWEQLLAAGLTKETKKPELIPKSCKFLVTEALKKSSEKHNDKKIPNSHLKVSDDVSDGDDVEAAGGDFDNVDEEEIVESDFDNVSDIELPLETGSTRTSEPPPEPKTAENSVIPRNHNLIVDNGGDKANHVSQKLLKMPVKNMSQEKNGENHTKANLGGSKSFKEFKATPNEANKTIVTSETKSVCENTQIVSENKTVSKSFKRTFQLRAESRKRLNGSKTKADKLSVLSSSEDEREDIGKIQTKNSNKFSSVRKTEGRKVKENGDSVEKGNCLQADNLTRESSNAANQKTNKAEEEASSEWSSLSSLPSDSESGGDDQDSGKAFVSRKIGTACSEEGARSASQAGSKQMSMEITASTTEKSGKSDPDCPVKDSGSRLVSMGESDDDEAGRETQEAGTEGKVEEEPSSESDLEDIFSFMAVMSPLSPMPPTPCPSSRAESVGDTADWQLQPESDELPLETPADPGVGHGTQNTSEGDQISKVSANEESNALPTPLSSSNDESNSPEETALKEKSSRRSKAFPVLRWTRARGSLGFRPGSGEEENSSEKSLVSQSSEEWNSRYREESAIQEKSLQCDDSELATPQTRGYAHIPSESDTSVAATSASPGTSAGSKPVLSQSAQSIEVSEGEDHASEDKVQHDDNTDSNYQSEDCRSRNVLGQTKSAYSNELMSSSGVHRGSQENLEVTSFGVEKSKLELDPISSKCDSQGSNGSEQAVAAPGSRTTESWQPLAKEPLFENGDKPVEQQCQSSGHMTKSTESQSLTLSEIQEKDKRMCNDEKMSHASVPVAGLVKTEAEGSDAAGVSVEGDLCHNEVFKTPAQAVPTATRKSRRLSSILSDTSDSERETSPCSESLKQPTLSEPGRRKKRGRPKKTDRKTLSSLTSQNGTHAIKNIAELSNGSTVSSNKVGEDSLISPKVVRQGRPTRSSSRESEGDCSEPDRASMTMRRTRRSARLVGGALRPAAQTSQIGQPEDIITWSRRRRSAKTVGQVKVESTGDGTDTCLRDTAGKPSVKSLEDHGVGTVKCETAVSSDVNCDDPNIPIIRFDGSGCLPGPDQSLGIGAELIKSEPPGACNGDTQDSASISAQPDRRGPGHASTRSNTDRSLQASLVEGETEYNSAVNGSTCGKTSFDEKNQKQAKNRGSNVLNRKSQMEVAAQQLARMLAAAKGSQERRLAAAASASRSGDKGGKKAADVPTKENPKKRGRGRPRKTPLAENPNNNGSVKAKREVGELEKPMRKLRRVRKAEPVKTRKDEEKSELTGSDLDTSSLSSDSEANGAKLKPSKDVFVPGSCSKGMTAALSKVTGSGEKKHRVAYPSRKGIDGSYGISNLSSSDCGAQLKEAEVTEVVDKLSLSEPNETETEEVGDKPSLSELNETESEEVGDKPSLSEPNETETEEVGDKPSLSEPNETETEEVVDKPSLSELNETEAEKVGDKPPPSKHGRLNSSKLAAPGERIVGQVTQPSAVKSTLTSDQGRKRGALTRGKTKPPKMALIRVDNGCSSRSIKVLNIKSKEFISSSCSEEEATGKQEERGKGNSFQSRKSSERSIESHESYVSQSVGDKKVPDRKVKSKEFVSSSSDEEEEKEEKGKERIKNVDRVKLLQEGQAPHYPSAFTTSPLSAFKAIRASSGENNSKAPVSIVAENISSPSKQASCDVSSRISENNSSRAEQSLTIESGASLPAMSVKHIEESSSCSGQSKSKWQLSEMGKTISFVKSNQSFEGPSASSGGNVKHLEEQISSGDETENDEGNGALQIDMREDPESFSVGLSGPKDRSPSHNIESSCENDSQTLLKSGAEKSCEGSKLPGSGSEEMLSVSREKEHHSRKRKLSSPASPASQFNKLHSAALCRDPCQSSLEEIFAFFRIPRCLSPLPCSPPPKRLCDGSDDGLPPQEDQPVRFSSAAPPLARKVTPATPDLPAVSPGDKFRASSNSEAADVTDVDDEIFVLSGSVSTSGKLSAQSAASVSLSQQMLKAKKLIKAKRTGTNIGKQKLAQVKELKKDENVKLENAPKKRQPANVGKFLTPYAAILHDMCGYVRGGGSACDASSTAANILTRVDGREVRPVWAMLPQLVVECLSSQEQEDVLLRLYTDSEKGDAIEDTVYLSCAERRLTAIVSQLSDMDKSLDKSSVMGAIWTEIFRQDTSRNQLEVFSFCRLFTALCMEMGDLEQARVMVYSIAWCGYLPLASSLVAVAGVWPQVLCSSPVCNDWPIKQVFIHLVIATYMEQDPPFYAKVCKVTQRLCKWKFELEVHDASWVLRTLQTELIRLASDIQSSVKSAEQIFTIMKAMELLLICKGAVWTEENFHKRMLVSAAMRWDLNVEDLRPRPGHIIALFRVFQSAIDVMPLSAVGIKLLVGQVFGRILNKRSNPPEVDDAMLESLMQLSPHSPARSLEILKAWQAAHLGKLPKHLEARLKDTLARLGQLLSEEPKEGVKVSKQANTKPKSGRRGGYRGGSRGKRGGRGGFKYH